MIGKGLSVLAASAVWLTTAPVSAGPLAEFAPGATGAVEFSTPSGNIGCTFIKAGGTAVYKPRDGGPELSCDRVAPKYTRVQIGRTGAATVITNVGDPSCCSAGNVLRHGENWHAGPFTCRSETSGLTCRRSDGRGFTVGRRGIAVK